MSVTESDGRHALWIAIVAGLAIRMVILFQTANLGVEIGDEQHYARIATNIVERHEFAMDAGRPTSMRPPLYPALVATIWSVAGVRNFQAVRAVQIGLGLIATWLVYQLGRRAFNERVGRYGAAVFWLYPSFIFFNSLILTETLFTLLLVAFVLAAVMLVQESTITKALGCGVLLGLAALSRSVLWPLPLVLCPLLVWLVGGSIGRKLTLSALVLAGYAVVIVPWAIRNTRLQGVVEIVDTMGGLNLRMGNYEHTPDDRMWDAVSLTGEKSWVYGLGGPGVSASPTEGEKEKWAQRQAIEYIKTHPGITLRRSLIKFADFWGLEREFASGVQQGLFNPPRWFAVSATILIILAYVAVALLGIAGMWVRPPAWRVHVLILLPFTAILGVHMLAFGHSRYHLPLVPILGIYAASLCVAWPFTRFHRFVWTGVAASCGILAIVWIRQIAFTDADRIRSLFHLAK